MKPRQLRKETEPEFRSDSYEASLTAKERQRLYAMLRSKLTIDEVVAKSIPWRTGDKAGEHPCWRTIYNIKSRLNLEEMLLSIEGSATIVERTRKELNALLKGTDGEKVLDRCMALIGQEVIHLTILRHNSEARNAAARLLLKRADQRRVDRRLDMLEVDLKKDAPGKTGPGLTPDEKQERIRQILGTE
jgi:hypothetical protein